MLSGFFFSFLGFYTTECAGLCLLTIIFYIFLNTSISVSFTTFISIEPLDWVPIIPSINVSSPTSICVKLSSILIPLIFLESYLLKRSLYIVTASGSFEIEGISNPSIEFLTLKPSSIVDLFTFDLTSRWFLGGSTILEDC